MAEVDILVKAKPGGRPDTTRSGAGAWRARRCSASCGSRAWHSGPCASMPAPRASRHGPHMARVRASSILVFPIWNEGSARAARTGLACGASCAPKASPAGRGKCIVGLSSGGRRRPRPDLICGVPVRQARHSRLRRDRGPALPDGAPTRLAVGPARCGFGRCRNGHHCPDRARRAGQGGIDAGAPVHRARARVWRWRPAGRSRSGRTTCRAGCVARRGSRMQCSCHPDICRRAGAGRRGGARRLDPALEQRPGRKAGQPAQAPETAEL